MYLYRLVAKKYGKSNTDLTCWGLYKMTVILQKLNGYFFIEYFCLLIWISLKLFFPQFGISFFIILMPQLQPTNDQRNNIRHISTSQLLKTFNEYFPQSHPKPPVRWLNTMEFSCYWTKIVPQCHTTVKLLIYGAPNPKTQMFLNSSCSCLWPIHWSQALSREWRCCWGSTDRRCSSYIWVINNFITY